MNSEIKENKPITKTFDFQLQLPRLPIPKLEDTLKKYRETLLPLLTSEELNFTDQNINLFLNQLGPILQSRLIQHAKSQKFNWLEDWWFQFAYLTWRVPLMIHSNWWMNIREDHLPPVMDMARVPLGPRKFSFVQLRRAACILSNLLDFKDLLDAEKIPPEMFKSKPLCMNQFRNLFGVTRIPQPGCDVLRTQFPCLSKHICVMVQDQLFIMDVYSSSHGRVPVHQLEATLTSIVDYIHQLNVQDRQPPIGILTAEQRDTWALARQHLLHLDPLNQEALEWIESSLLVVSLEDVSAGPFMDVHHRWMAHGVFGHNRWFDKSLNLIVTNSGQAGCCGEHSPQDALTPTMLFEHALLREKETFQKASHPVLSSTSSMVPFRHLHWKVDGPLKHVLEKAEQNNRALVKASDIGLFIFKDYGKEWMKRQSFSPDAFVQMALQLTYFRMHGHVTSTYETASTRSFLHGRTETCRSCSMASKQFVEKIYHPDVSPSEKILSLTQAIDAHVKYIQMASQGQGVDRHLLGLRLMKRPEEPCSFFEDEAYRRSSEWRLSTSNLGPSSYKVFRGTGFGPVHPDGYGINYFLGPNEIHFGIASNHTSPSTSTDLFRVHLMTSLHDMKKLMDGTLGSMGLSSKL
ncbi:hypothetical protein HMI54_011207 [Coelomomyces lativittatus]|nr:hypothetical protein HMI55_001383 [Coelomomyces lativittatus]KAJ1515319.1 hypothetical protein HMI56_005749 [Coelomomyces lativittatus]KAJ1516007.1 hypothetical protein HMI54_011207 [Coelomomyces lativittatus]